MYNSVDVDKELLKVMAGGCPNKFSINQLSLAYVWFGCCPLTNPDTVILPGITTVSAVVPNIIWLLAVFVELYPNATEPVYPALCALLPIAIE